MQESHRHEKTRAGFSQRTRGRRAQLYLRMLLGTGHLLLQEVLCCLQAVLLEMSLCNDKRQEERVWIQKPGNHRTVNYFSENTKNLQRMCWWGDGGDPVDSRWLEQREHRRSKYPTLSYSEEHVWFWKSEAHFWASSVPDFISFISQ